MKAAVGDWLLVQSHRADVHARRAEIRSVGPDGAPPYTVRWADEDREAIVYPGPDAEIVSAQRLAELDRLQAEKIAGTKG
jgi:hypothetical protein